MTQAKNKQQRINTVNLQWNLAVQLVTTVTKSEETEDAVFPASPSSMV